MKRFKELFRLAAVLISCSLTTIMMAQTQQVDTTLNSDIDISLLTCGPGDAVYSLYGHTAIRIQNKSIGEDIAVNYGIFSFNKSFFILKFIFGLTDYTMAIAPYDAFIESYAEEGRWVTEQKLNLSDDEKMRILNAISVNYLPENREYRYNYFYDNCTTRARNIIADNLNSKAVFPDAEPPADTFRKSLKLFTSNHPWAQFGDDLLLGVGADRTIDRRQWQFLPENLMDDFAAAYIDDGQQGKRMLVSETNEVLTFPDKQGQDLLNTTFTPRNVMVCIALIILLITVLELLFKRSCLALDFILLSVTGIAGLILFVMIFSQHPTVRLNLQILLLNPLSLFMAYPVVKSESKGKPHRYWNFLFYCIILFLIGNTLQNYAEGMNILAMALVIRCWTKLSHKNRKGA